MRKILLTLGLVLTPAVAFAHTGGGEASGFLHGFGHPVGGLDHVLAMVGVGILAFVLGGRALWLVPAAFVAMMVVGFALGINLVDLPMVELGIALSIVVIGGAAALGRSLPLGLAMALVGVFAIFHGHAHGTEMPANSGGLTYALGFVLATALLHAAGVLASLAAARAIGRHGQMVARAAGGLFAVGGLGVLSGWL
ncbi:HupE/UreJ family protein [Fulvimarina sp. 2208YS6-2-32]|uniref:HupE/UreJ family protein n=1 Tax=Fulvimarina uroteuthidis TaxID=3098149 RepID=A0ABU5I544_9HYPH|nr:HupE/UreJ family protein [Fulvimarina sp. 2208YS6-2-32]MDY8110521.1 HupE/UreJ family protein [Fulvimarina sp. 2208YS6-2-32]